jgi:hypothetical protein
MRVLALVVALLSMPALSCQTAAAELTSQQAASHVGETATVCGTVASANYATRTKGQPTFLNLDQPYPRQLFTVVIWGSDRTKFGTAVITESARALNGTRAPLPERTIRGREGAVSTGCRSWT